MRLEKCYVCSSTIYPGHGSMFVRNDAKIFRFCRSKCRRNFNLKRNPRKLRWTKAFRKAAGKELAIDTSFAFERRRNRAVKYDRDLVAKTLQAIPVIQKVRSEREHDFYRTRMVEREKETRKDALRELATGLDVIKPLIVREKLREREEKESAMEVIEEGLVDKS
ncbi:putative ribosome biogenesis protein RLP24 [Gracilariopsis chorda]|uniref:Putative ribosome biogenesis protein RLP24 n=1 Tax=Gracilariopsis chorda TaxID=448386 RepID=A0A2V3IN31_9FLOR|nr:putative ribosome biogenesis protein RLP24 [Gracilariopsis chorda]|eukprot:PXF43467.1 putative ribosome biogenesis protein RLP24 [Gracilariopsis chorda]